MKFTGKQITVMVVAISAATILTPAAVYASTGSSVNITDPVYSSAKARVVGGKLEVGDGSGPLTVDGLVRVTDGSGPLTVDGTVNANILGGTVKAVPTDPTTAWSKLGDITNNGTDQVVLGDLPANVGLALGSIMLSNTAGSAVAQVQVAARFPTTAHDCTSGTSAGYFGLYSVPANDTRSISFAPLLRLTKQTQETCYVLYVTGGSGTTGVSVQATGSTY